MSKVIAEAEVGSFLSELTEWTEIRDKQGNLLGYFTPAKEELALSYAELGHLFDPEELKRRREQSRGEPGISTEQLLAKLHALEKPHEMDRRVGTSG